LYNLARRVNQTFVLDDGKEITFSKADVYRLVQFQQSDSLLSKMEKEGIEKSPVYITYKLLWVTKMFIEGKKFPSGSLSGFKQQKYIFDIIRFLTNPQFLGYLLKFDPDSIFKVIRMFFIDVDLFNFLQNQEAFVQMYAETLGIENCPDHTEIIEIISKQIQTMKDNNEEISAVSNAFIFFVAHIAERKEIKIPENLYG
jgi:hypothetical protein